MYLAKYYDTNNKEVHSKEFKTIDAARRMGKRIYATVRIEIFVRSMNGFELLKTYCWDVKQNIFKHKTIRNKEKVNA